MANGSTAAQSGFYRLKRALLGDPLRTAQRNEERVSKTIGLALFSSDALSSVAYATDEIFLILFFAAGSTALGWSMPIAVAIAFLLLTVVASYRQVIEAYPGGGGAYVVAKENLGVVASLTCGAALIIDYILTVSVSVSAGIAALVSAFPNLEGHRVGLGLAAILVMMFGNLRGIRESGKVFSVPAYFFILTLTVLLVAGGTQIALGVAISAQTASRHPVSGLDFSTVGWFLILHAFASGCAALTGVEAISNGVPAFKPPEAKNARATMAWMGLILGALFLSITALSNAFHLEPVSDQTLLSQLAHAVFGNGPAYYMVQASTMLILVLAANTSFSAFPILASMLGNDRFLPRQLGHLGDRLSFSNGIILLGLFSGFLVFLFNGDTHRLIPLYAIGVFLSFTLAQAGMVRYWRRGKPAGWRRRSIINGFGATVTAAVLLILAVEKFRDGAWIVIMILPLMILMFINIRRHYATVAAQLTLDDVQPLKSIQHTIVVPIGEVHKGVLYALEYAKCLSERVRAVYVSMDQAAEDKIRAKWIKWEEDVPLIILKSPYRSVMQPLLDYLDQVHKERPDDMITVVLPEFIPGRWWHHLLHNQTALMLKGLLLFKRGVVVTSVPHHLRR